VEQASGTDNSANVRAKVCDETSNGRADHNSTDTNESGCDLAIHAEILEPRASICKLSLNVFGYEYAARAAG
jgi:hypothetical protein